VLELLLGQGLLQEGETGVGYREATVELATGGVGKQRLLSSLVSIVIFH
jgi:hypothetical protein